jgi:hypothetical protein
MKCPKCRAVVDDGIDRCTFCGHYFQGSMMDGYRLDGYDPTQGYRTKAAQPSRIVEPQKSKFRLFKRG